MTLIYSTYLKIVDLHVDSAVVQKVEAAQSSKPGTDQSQSKKEQKESFDSYFSEAVKFSSRKATVLLKPNSDKRARS